MRSMDIATLLLVWTIGPIILLAFAYVISRTIFRILLKLFSLAFLLTLIIGGYAGFTAWQFTQRLQEQPQLYVYGENLSAVKAGFLNPPLREGMNKRGIRWYDPSNAEQLMREAGTIILITPAFLEDANMTSIQGVSVGNVTRILNADDPFSLLAEELAAEQGYPVSAVRIALINRYGNASSTLKGEIFAAGIGSLLADDPARLLWGLRNSTLRVIPPPFFARLLPLFPERLIRLSEEWSMQALARMNMSG